MYDVGPIPNGSVMDASQIPLCAMCGLWGVAAACGMQTRSGAVQRLRQKQSSVLALCAPAGYCALEVPVMLGAGAS